MQSSTFLIIFLLITGFVSGYGLFFPDKFAQYTQQQKVVGKLVTLDKLVKKKYQNLFTWQDASQDDLLHPGDQIFTTAGASATISLGGNTLAMLEENSLFYLDYHESQATINIPKGKIYLEIQGEHRPLQIKINNKVMMLKGKNARLKLAHPSSKEQQGVQITLERGDAFLETTQEKEKSTISLPLAKTVDLIPNPQPTIAWHPREVEWKILLLGPNDLAEILVDYPGQLIEFNWKVEQRPETSPETSGELQLLIAEDQNFKIALQQYSVNTPPFNWPVPKIGRFFWKIVTSDPAGESSVRHFEIKKSAPLPMPVLKKLPPIQIELQKKKIAPTKSSWFRIISNHFLAECWAQTSVEALTAENDEKVALINWDSDPRQKYFLEIYLDSEGKKIVQQAEVATNSYEWRSPRPGNYYWRLALIDAWGAKGDFTPLMRLIIGEKLDATSENVPADAVTLIGVGDGDIVDLRTDTTVQFSWHATEGLKAFKLQIAKDLAFQEIFWEKSGQATSLLVPISTIIGPGEFYWRVIGNSKKKMVVSAVKKFVALKSAIPPSRKIAQVPTFSNDISYLWQISQLSWQADNLDEKILLTGNTSTSGVVATNFSLGQDWSAKLKWQQGKVNANLPYHNHQFNLLWRLARQRWSLALGPSLHFSGRYRLGDDGNLQETSKFLSALHLTVIQKYRFNHRWHFLIAGMLEFGSAKYQEYGLQVEGFYHGVVSSQQWSPHLLVGAVLEQYGPQVTRMDYFGGLGIKQFF